MDEISRARTGNGRLISIEDIEHINGVDFETAKREYDYVRNAQLTYSQDLLVYQYCKYRGLDFQEIIVFLGTYSTQSTYPSLFKN